MLLFKLCTTMNSCTIAKFILVLVVLAIKSSQVGDDRNIFVQTYFADGLLLWRRYTQN